MLKWDVPCESRDSGVAFGLKIAVAVASRLGRGSWGSFKSPLEKCSAGSCS
jgi:hypothetical protein